MSSGNAILVQDVFEGGNVVIIVQSVNIIVDGNIAHSALGKIEIGVLPRLNVISAKS